MLAFAKQVDGGYSILSGFQKRSFEVELPKKCPKTDIPVVVAPNIHDKLFSINQKHVVILGVLKAQMVEVLKKFQHDCNVKLAEGLEAGSSDAFAYLLASTQVMVVFEELKGPWADAHEKLFAKYLESVELTTNLLAEKQGFNPDGTEKEEKLKLY